MVTLGWFVCQVSPWRPLVGLLVSIRYDIKPTLDTNYCYNTDIACECSYKLNELLFVYGYSSHDLSIFVRYKLFDTCILALYTFFFSIILSAAISPAIMIE